MYQHEGKKFLWSTFGGAPILAWALPPGSHDEDSRKALIGWKQLSLLNTREPSLQQRFTFSRKDSSRALSS